MALKMHVHTTRKMRFGRMSSVQLSDGKSQLLWDQKKRLMGLKNIKAKRAKMKNSFVAFGNTLQIPKQKRLIIGGCNAVRAHLRRRAATRTRISTAGEMKRGNWAYHTRSRGRWLIHIGRARVELYSGPRRRGGRGFSEQRQECLFLGGGLTWPTVKVRLRRKVACIRQRSRQTWLAISGLDG